MGERERKQRRGARTLTSAGERQRGGARRSAHARERACIYLLRGTKHVGQHDVGAIDDHMKAQRLLLTIDLVHITAEQGRRETWMRAAAGIRGTSGGRCGRRGTSSTVSG
jgi:hypothetical protein